MIDRKHAAIELLVFFDELVNCLRGSAAATRQGDVRMPRAQIGLDIRSQRRFAHLFVELKEMRMTLAHSHPNDRRSASRFE